MGSLQRLNEWNGRSLFYSPFVDSTLGPSHDSRAVSRHQMQIISGRHWNWGGKRMRCGYHKVARETHSLRYEQEEKGGCHVPCPLAGEGAGSEYSTFLRLRGAILIGGVQLKFAPPRSDF